VFLQYFDTVGWVVWPVKTVARITYTVLVETLNPAQSINQLILDTDMHFMFLLKCLFIFTVQCYAECALATGSLPSVCLSVTLRCDHTGCNT